MGTRVVFEGRVKGGGFVAAFRVMCAWIVGGGHGRETPVQGHGMIYLDGRGCFEI